MNSSNTKKYRSKGRIMADILSAIKEDEDAKITHILYKANLSYDRLSRYLEELEESELIQTIDSGDRSLYRITERGQKFLVEFRRMEEFAEAFGLDI